MWLEFTSAIDNAKIAINFDQCSWMNSMHDGTEIYQANGERLLVKEKLSVITSQILNRENFRRG